MRKKFIYVTLMIISLFIIVGCSQQEQDKMHNEKDINFDNNDNINEVITSMKIMINDKEYLINLEDNETVKEFINMLPIEAEMDELNGNEKYLY